MDEEKLITMVRERRELYDLNHPLYDVRPKRDLAWKQIGEALKHSPRDCRDKWKRLRDCYRRAQKLRRIKSKQGAKIIKRPKYEQLLTFLNAHLRDDVRTAAEQPDSSNDDSSLADDAPSPGAAEPALYAAREPALYAAPEPALYAAPEPALYAAPLPDAAPPRDKVTDFFMGLIETVKDLPEDVQIRVKRDVFKVVSDAEELVYKSKTENPLSRIEFVKEEH
ncbi:hypothetical protein PYW07_008183 [Mythimna separata]|uniref:Transcription factor Adf-1 n=1 Tax=Mythimna separata TaxID=271217 RepID=A0AAD8DVM2_MYTSE|nr:hypothetical protein PYW07_008183 [Mythimna separata]